MTGEHEHEIELACCDRCGASYCAGCGGCTWGCPDWDDDEGEPCGWCGTPGCPGYCNVEDYNVREDA